MSLTDQEPQLVDGVPVYVAHRGDGPCAGGVLFRVGMVDEEPRWRGASHLVEHLVLAPLAGRTSHYNGETTIDTTGFHIQGTSTEVVDFLGQVCASLAHLPTADLEKEKSILRTEEAGRSRSVTDSLGIFRFGARSYGRSALPEWGVPGLGAEDLRRWVQHYFTSGNAVCWIVADDLPAGLRLVLPQGERRPAPPPTSALPQTPAYYAGGSGLIAWSSVVERSTASVVLAQMVRRDLFRSLRTEAGLSYDVNGAYQPRSGDVADLLLSADALEEKQDAALGTFLRALTRMKVGRLEAEDLEAVRTERLALYERADLQRLTLGTRAYDALIGYPRTPATELVAELRALTLADVAAVGQRAYATGLLRVPAGRGAENAGFVRAPDTSPTGVDGQRYTGHQDPAVTMTVGPFGVSWSNGERFATVPYADCEALLVYPDGARQLVGGDGMNVAVEPNLYAGLAAAVPMIDAAVPRSAHVLVPRDAEDVPQVDHAALEQRRREAAYGRTPRSAVAVVAVTVLIVLGWLVLGLLALGGIGILAEGDPDGWIALGIAVGIGGLLLWGTISWRRSGRRG